MFELFVTTPHTSIRQMRIKSQNMIVLAVEFTRNPLFHRGRCLYLDLQQRLHHPLDVFPFH
jgi:hypothetical protein